MDKAPKPPKFSFEKLKAEATSPILSVRMHSFKTYFEQFHEFPSYLFDNETKVDDMLLQTVRALEKDRDTSETMRKALGLLMDRLPAIS